MWCFTDAGFFALAFDQKEGVMLVRARHPGHLEQMRKDFPVLKDCGIRDTRHEDYGWKMPVPRDVMGMVMCDMVTRIDYRRFKPASHNREARGEVDRQYGHLLLNVWSTVYRYQRVCFGDAAFIKNAPLPRTKGFAVWAKEHEDGWRKLDRGVYGDHTIDAGRNTAAERKAVLASRKRRSWARDMLGTEADDGIPDIDVEAAEEDEGGEHLFTIKTGD